MQEFVAPAGQKDSMSRMAEAENYAAWLVDRVQPYLGARVLDFGAGTGTITQLLAHGREVVALDPDPVFLELLRERFAGDERVTVVPGDHARLEEMQGPFDSIVCMNVLEHIADDVGTLRRMHGLLRDGGCVLLVVPAHKTLFGAIDRNVGHERRYDKNVLGGRLREAGFDVADLRYVNPLGAVGWIVSSRLLRRSQVPALPLRLYDRLVPALRPLDALQLPFGLSLWAVARRPATSA